MYNILKMDHVMLNIHDNFHIQQVQIKQEKPSIPNPYYLYII
jgi:hypothetical protein